MGLQISENQNKVRVDSEGSSTALFDRESIVLETTLGQAHLQTGLVKEAMRGRKAKMTAAALEHPEIGAHKSLARAVAASNWREEVRGHSPLQHAMEKAPDLDGRFYAAEYEALPNVQGELVDETYGNNTKRMQDSDVNFVRWAYQNRRSRVLNSKNRKAQMFRPGTCVFDWREVEQKMRGSFKGMARVLCTELRTDSEKKGSIGTLLLTSGKPRRVARAWLCRAGQHQ